MEYWQRECWHCNAQADGSELKGPGNVTIKRLGYNVAFDPNADIMGGRYQGYDRV